MDIVAGVATIAQAPLAATPVGISIANAIKTRQPQYRLRKWAERVERIITAVADKEDIIPSEVMATFIEIIEEYVRHRITYKMLVNDGQVKWYGKGNDHSKKHSSLARASWEEGLSNAGDVNEPSTLDSPLRANVETISSPESSSSVHNDESHVHDETCPPSYVHENGAPSLHHDSSSPYDGSSAITIQPISEEEFHNVERVLNPAFASLELICKDIEAWQSRASLLDRNRGHRRRQ
ncbi:hypothetical protein CVT25_000232 [Psilocybe cyanescens]|uniref:Uncharacterized protein n=1 Tax=Psilocybe cyanescens TaxID=93625 RepID=A0A409XS66_PSICY|nr:hypothetical protein CVT25_000232 [Psilocybe cyanescens]